MSALHDDAPHTPVNTLKRLSPCPSVFSLSEEKIKFTTAKSATQQSDCLEEPK